MSQETVQFSKWRALFWPIHGYELKKVLPMFFMLALIVFNYTILRDTKDTLVVSAAGAEALPFLKLWGVLPGAIIFMLIYSKFSNILAKETLFYTAITPFLVFFGVFALYLYPNVEALKPEESANWLQAWVEGSSYFSGLTHFVSCYRYWPLSLFYIMSELWGSAAVSLLFWGFANDITHVSESKRFYAVFLIGANIALLVSGPLIVYFSQSVGEEFAQSINYLMATVVISGLITIGLYRYMNSVVLHDPRFYNPSEEKKMKKSKPKMSVGESLVYLAKSPYILCLATLVIAYGISINVVEGVWKNQLKLQYPDKGDYNAFMGKFSFMTGLTTILLLVFLSGNIMRKLGWGFSAMVTPVVLLITGISFFSFVLFKDNLLGFVSLFGSTPIMMAVMLGATQNIMSKSAKYSLFDPTKEMAYIPLDQEQKVKGKAAIDVVGARLGKSGGAFVQMILVTVLGSITATFTYYVMGVFIVVIIGWLFAVRNLNKKFVELTRENALNEKD